jgi:hypothetical protein
LHQLGRCSLALLHHKRGLLHIGINAQLRFYFRKSSAISFASTTAWYEAQEEPLLDYDLEGHLNVSVSFS